MSIYADVEVLKCLAQAYIQVSTTIGENTEPVVIKGLFLNVSEAMHSYAQTVLASGQRNELSNEFVDTEMSKNLRNSYFRMKDSIEKGKNDNAFIAAHLRYFGECLMDLSYIMLLLQKPDADTAFIYASALDTRLSELKAVADKLHEVIDVPVQGSPDWVEKPMYVCDLQLDMLINLMSALKIYTDSVNVVESTTEKRYKAAQTSIMSLQHVPDRSYDHVKELLDTATVAVRKYYNELRIVRMGL